MTKRVAADRCIYCDELGNNRTDEHVIPKSIGGRLVIPKASCLACQLKIDKEIENPLFGNQYVFLRDRDGLRKKGAGNKRQEKNQTHQNSIHIVGMYNFPPFERYFLIPFSHHPPILWVNRYPNPPFMSTAEREIRTQSSQSLSSINLVSLNHYAAEYLPKEGLVSYTFQFPNWTEGQFRRLLAKVACGIYFTFLGDQVDCSPFKESVADGSNGSAAPYIFSCSVCDFSIDDHFFHIFEKMEDEVPWVYCGIRLLPSIIDEVYFFRARRKILSKKIEHLSDYSAQ